MTTIGTIIGGYKVIAASPKALLAQALTPETPEQYVCWLYVPERDYAYSGEYTNDKMEAEWCFCSRSFEWFDDNVITADTDDELPEEQFTRKECDEAFRICFMEDEHDCENCPVRHKYPEGDNCLNSAWNQLHLDTYNYLTN